MGPSYSRHGTRVLHGLLLAALLSGLSKHAHNAQSHTSTLIGGTGRSLQCYLRVPVYAPCAMHSQYVPYHHQESDAQDLQVMLQHRICVCNTRHTPRRVSQCRGCTVRSL